MKEEKMAHEKILIIEDDRDILELISYNLEKEGYRTYCSATGELALPQIGSLKPDLILLDLMLPGMDGLEICKQLKQREETRNIPVIMVTAKSEDSDIVTGLEIGADDYISKPFSPKVLIARIRTILRRSRKVPDTLHSDIINIADITIDVSRHEVVCGKKHIDLSATEFAILKFLAENPEWVFSRNQIIGAVKGEDYPVTERSVDVQILGLRKKLGERGRFIQTVRGVGYRMKVDV
jgi:two-component system phosphate regulon response regulator PhoB